MPAFDRARSLVAAEKFVKAGKMPEAIAEYKKLADDNPRDMNVVNKLGDLLVRAGKVPTPSGSSCGSPISMPGWLLPQSHRDVQEDLQDRPEESRVPAEAG